VSTEAAAGLRLGGTPVLLYHAVGDGPLSARDRRYQVSVARFDGHLGVVAASGRRVVSLAQLWAGVGERVPAAAITIDDGRESDYRVIWPRLRERGWTAEFFVNPGTVGQPGYVTWAQVREMAEAGMGVQSHGYDHVTLWGLGRAALRRQLGDSRRALEDATGRAVEFLAAPFGHLTGAVVHVALEEGYRAVCTSWSWPARPGARTMGRVAVYDGTSGPELARVLEGRVLTYGARALRTALVYPPKRLMVALQPARFGAAVAEHGW
jgi:peptidoglycan/xylan/chitin deacetylase (PgdA/CDA1 family)